MKVYLLSKDPKQFLKFSIERDIRDKSYIFISPYVLEMFDDPMEYRKLVADNPVLMEDIRAEYLELFDKVAATNFKEYVDMEFKSELRKPENS